MNKAFTLIELLITISIMMLFLIVSLPAFRQYGYLNELNQAVGTIENGITETQTLSFAPTTNKNIQLNCYYIILTQNDYSIYAAKYSNGTIETDSQVKISSASVPKNVKISAVPSKIIYSIASQGRIIYPTSNLLTNGEMAIQLIHDKLNSTLNSKKVILKVETGQIRTE